MKMYKRLIVIAITLIMTVLSAQIVSADNLPYYSYTQDLAGEQVAIAAPYKTTATIKNISGTTALNDPQDISYKNGRIYIADTGNNRVLMLDKNFNFLGELCGLAAPSGVFATEENLYISDTGNGRILKTDRNLTIVEIFKKPEIAILGDAYSYLPKKLAVDYSGRMYIIAQGVNRGIIQLNNDGTFFNFLGAPKVNYNLYELFLRSISTEEQLDNMEKFVPTEYNSINIDEHAFLFATSSSTSVTAIAKMNLSGDNILKQPEGVEIKGELLSDIALTEDGSMYSVADVSSGKIYTYDEDGYFLFEFGGNGDSHGLHRSPVALEYMEDLLLVIDSVGSKLTVYEKTEFCDSVEQAISCYKKGKYNEAYDLFDSVLRTSSNFTYAQLGIAKIEIQRGNYGTAMNILKAIGEKTYYSVAFKEQRKEYFRSGLLWVIVICAVLVALYTVCKRVFAKKRSRLVISTTLGNQLLYSKYVIFHPFDGFWDIKHERRGSVASASVLYAVFLIEFALWKVAKGYLFSSSEDIKLSEELIICVLTILLWCLANWALTTLLEGKGKFGDIFTGTAYALVPFIITSPFFIAISHIITMDEAALYFAANTVIYIWVGALLLFGMLSIHDYSLSKMLWTTILTVLGMAVILFLLLVFFNMLQTAYDFFFNIFKEVSLRT